MYLVLTYVLLDSIRKTPQGQNPDALQDAIDLYRSKITDQQFHEVTTKVASKRSTKHMPADAHKVSEVQHLLKVAELSNKDLGDKLQKHKWVTLAQACRSLNIAASEKDTKAILVDKLVSQVGYMLLRINRFLTFRV